MGEKTLTQKEFQAAVSTLNLKPQTMKIARAVLVEGRKQVEMAIEHSLSRGAISQAVTKVWEARSLPCGYEKVTETLTLHQAFIVRKWGKENIQQLNNKESTA